MGLSPLHWFMRLPPLGSVSVLTPKSAAAVRLPLVLPCSGGSCKLVL
jgi:hypothetical protein